MEKNPFNKTYKTARSVNCEYVADVSSKAALLKV